MRKCKRPKAWQHKLVNSVFFALLFTLLPMALDYLYLRFLPVSYWFEYEQITPIEETLVSGEFPRFVSHGEIKKPAHFRWVDVIRCKDDIGEFFHKSYESTAYIEHPRTFPTIELDPKTGREITSSWQYGFKLPDRSDITCYLDSSISAELQFGIKKIQTLRTEYFVIK